MSALREFKSDQLVLELVNRDLRSLSEELKSIILYQIGSSLKETLVIEARSFTGNSKDLNSFEKVDPESFICSDDRSLPVIKFIEGITGKDFNTLPVIPSNPKVRKLHIPETTLRRNYDLAGRIYECLLKLANSNCLPPISLSNKIDVRTKINSRTALESDKLGGSYKTISGVNIKSEIPHTSDCHALVIDNGQKGRGKVQKKQRLKLNQKVEVNVHTNVISVVPKKFEHSQVLKKSSNLPGSYEEHPFFNKCCDSEYDNLLMILQDKMKKCDEVKDVILQDWFKDVVRDIAMGGGVSSVQKTFCENKSDKIVSFFCHKCHYKLDYDVKSENVCPECNENPTFCDPAESPFDKYKIVGNPKTVEVTFQEPLCYNPVGFNLVGICSELSARMPPGDQIQCIVSDALINVGLQRIKRQVLCVTHNEIFAIWDVAKVAEHSSRDCEWCRPLENVVNFDGQSHELMTMILNYTRVLKVFGLKEYVKLQGFVTECAQETAIGGKYLRRLVEIVLPFTEGAMRALMDSYIIEIGVKVGDKFDLESFKRFMESCPNLRARALYNVIMQFGLPVIVKHVALRFSRPDIARFASADFTPLSFLMNNLMYRENYCFSFIHDGPDGETVQGEANEGGTLHGEANEESAEQGEANEGGTVHDEANEGRTVEGEVNQGRNVQGEANEGGTVQGEPNERTVQAKANDRGTDHGEAGDGGTEQAEAGIGGTLQAPRVSDRAALPAVQAFDGSTVKALDACDSGTLQATSETATVPAMERSARDDLVNAAADEALRAVIKDLRNSKQKNSVKAYTVKGKYIPGDLKELKEEVVIIDRSRDGKSGQGADMCQEEFLKKGLSKVVTGQINSFPVFRAGIRSAYFTDVMKGDIPTKRNKRRFKFVLEAMSSSLVQLRQGNILDLDKERDLGDLDMDLLNIRRKGLDNLKIFFLQYISGLKAPTSIKLEPLFIKMTDRQKFESIESKTKAEILEKIQGFNLDELDFIAPDVLEVLFKRKFNVSRFTKAELVVMYQKLVTAQEEVEILKEIERDLD